MTATRTYEELGSELLADGYSQIPPRAGAEEIDSGVCARSRCDECGNLGLRYHPFTRPGSYRAVAECPECGAAFEF